MTDKVEVGDKSTPEGTLAGSLGADARAEMLDEALKSQIEGTEANAPASGGGKGPQSLSEKLLDKGFMPALDKKDFPVALAEAADLMKGHNIGLPSDGGKSSGTSISRLLQAAGADLQLTPFIPHLKAELEKLGWESFDLKDKSQLKPGDVVFTSMDPQGRNAGIVGKEGMIYSHNFRSQQFEGRTNWTSKFVTVMRQKDQ